MNPQHLQLIDHVLSGNATAAQRDEFSALVLADDVFTAAAARHAAMLAEIHERFTGAVVTTIEPTAAPSQSAIANRQSAISSPIPFIIYPISIAAAALLTAAIVVVYLLAFTTSADPQPDPIKPNQPGPSVATLIENTGDLTTPHGYPAEGEDFSAGEYSLSTGTAEFMLTNAVNVKLRGETRLWMRNDMNVALTRGSANFVVPRGAKGFAVHLPGRARIIDLGTKFRVIVRESGEIDTFVTQGSIRIERLDADGRAIESRVVAQTDGLVRFSDRTLSIAVPSTGDTNLVRNGGFEPEDGSPRVKGKAFDVAPGETIAHWTQSADGAPGHFFSSERRAASGEQSYHLGAVSGKGAVSQSIETVPGRRYRLTFDSSGYPGESGSGAGTPHRGSVTVDETRHEYTTPEGASYEDMGWTPQAIEFTAIDLRTTLTFGSPAGAAGSITIDNVRVIEIPEITAADAPASRPETKSNVTPERSIR